MQARRKRASDNIGTGTYGPPVASTEFSTNIYIHADHSPADDLRASTLNDHYRGI